MDMTYLAGRTFSNLTKGYKEEGSNDWTVSVTMTESLIYPNGLERMESVSGLATNSDFDLAHKEAMREVLQQLQDLIYSRGFDSLVEAVDYDRSMEALGDSDVETFSNETPASE